MRMTSSLLLTSAILFLPCGCYQPELSKYAPRGTSCDNMLPSFGMELPAYFVRKVGDSASPSEIAAEYSYDILRVRSATPGFRMLCSIVNTYFEQWERLVIIERLEHGGNDETGFVVVAVMPSGLTAVTNYGLKGPEAGMWVATEFPRLFKVDRERFQSLMVRLDLARETLPRGLFLFPNVDWPVYILHDIKSDGSYLAYGIAGWAEAEDDTMERLLKAQPTYAEAAKLVGKMMPWQGIEEGSQAARELRQAVATYAALVDMVWQCTLGRPDYFIIGVDPLAAPRARGSRARGVPGFLSTIGQASGGG